jgi:hypothetical protein
VLTLCCGLLIFLLPLLIALWVVSHWHPSTVHYTRTTGDRTLFLASKGGDLEFRVQAIRTSSPAAHIRYLTSHYGHIGATNTRSGWAVDTDMHSVPSRPPRYGVTTIDSTFNVDGVLYSQHLVSVSIRYAVICPAIGFLAACALLLRLRLKRNRRVGVCPNCDYDVRATPARCPECGWIPVASADSAHSTWIA